MRRVFPHFGGLIPVRRQYAHRSVPGETMASHNLAIGVALVFCFIPREPELASTSLLSHLGDNTLSPAKEGNDGADAKDWPTYNGDVLGSRHNVGETALDKADVARLEEKWRFPSKGADFQIGVIHATPAVVSGYVYFGTVNQAAFYKLTPNGRVQWSFR